MTYAGTVKPQYLDTTIGAIRECINFDTKKAVASLTDEWWKDMRCYGTVTISDEQLGSLKDDMDEVWPKLQPGAVVRTISTPYASDDLYRSAVDFSATRESDDDQAVPLEDHGLYEEMPTLRVRLCNDWKRPGGIIHLDLAEDGCEYPRALARAIAKQRNNTGPAFPKHAHPIVGGWWNTCT